MTSRGGCCGTAGPSRSCRMMWWQPRSPRAGRRGVFAGGDAVRQRKMTVRAVADGKEAAWAIRQYLLGEEVIGPEKAFNSRMGKLQEGEIDVFLQSAGAESRPKALA